MAPHAKVAIRHVFRNRRPTLITLAAMGLRAATLILFGGFDQRGAEISADEGLYAGVRANLSD